MRLGRLHLTFRCRRLYLALLRRRRLGLATPLLRWRLDLTVQLPLLGWRLHLTLLLSRWRSLRPLLWCLLWLFLWWTTTRRWLLILIFVLLALARCLRENENRIARRAVNRSKCKGGEDCSRQEARFEVEH